MAQDEDNQSREESTNIVNTTINQTSKTFEESLKSIINPQTQLITVTLDDSNFLLWKFQLEMAIKGYGLQKFIDPETKIPPQVAANQEGQITANTDFLIYSRQDSLLCSWILSSISPNLLSSVIGCKTSLEVWNAIHQNFNSQAAARIMSYKRQLQNIRKESMNVREYLSKIKNLCDLLESSGHKVNETEHVLNILNGLGEEFEAIVAVISSRETTPSVQYVSSILLAHEGRLEQKNSATSEFSINLVANTKNKGTQTNLRFESSANIHQEAQGGRGNYTHERGRGFNRGRGRGRSFNNRPKCQICGKIGHTAVRCYFRFESNYNSNQQVTPNQGTSRSHSYNVNLTQARGDTGNTPNHQVSQGENQIYVAEDGDLLNESWFPDSGATHHVTNNLHNLNLGGAAYRGKNSIHMGNGTPLNISHIGNTHFASAKRNKNMLLRNLLRVPQIKKNLISVSQFASDNHVFLNSTQIHV